MCACSTSVAACLQNYYNVFGIQVSNKKYLPPVIKSMVLEHVHRLVVAYRTDNIFTRTTCEAGLAALPGFAVFSNDTRVVDVIKYNTSEVRRPTTVLRDARCIAMRVHTISPTRTIHADPVHVSPCAGVAAGLLPGRCAARHPLSPHGFVGCDLRDASNNLTHEWAVSGYHLKVCAALWGAGLGCRLL